MMEKKCIKNCNGSKCICSDIDLIFFTINEEVKNQNIIGGLKKRIKPKKPIKQTKSKTKKKTSS